MGLQSWWSNLVGGAAAVVPVTESMPGLDYDDPDLNLPGTQASGNWRRITQAASDLAPFKQDQMQQLALYLSDRNPIARGLLDLIVSFVVGEGFAVRSKDEDVQKVIDRFWDDAQNDMDSRVEDLCRELSIYGEQLVLAFVNETSGRVALVSVDPRQIRAVAPHPLASDRAYAVGLAADTEMTSVYRWVKIIAEDPDPRSETFGMLVGAAAGETLTVGGSTVPFYQPPPQESMVDTTRLVGCFFWATNKPRSALRGRSDLLAVADNVDMLDQFLFDEGQRMSFQRSFVWDCELTGADDAKVRERAAQSVAPKPGSTLFHNESETWTVMAPDLNTQDSANYADLQLGTIATAWGVPKSWINGTMDVNRATAQETQEPGIKRMVRRQKFVIRMLERLVRFALDQAEIAGALPPSDDGRHPFTVSAPEMSSRDMQRGASSLQTTVQAMGMATAAHWVDTQTAQDATALMLSQLGLDVDMEEVRARLETEAADQAEAESNEIPDYFGMGKFAGSDVLARALGGGSSNGKASHGANGTPDTAGGLSDGPVVPVVSPAAKDVAAIIAQVSKALVDLGNAQVIDGEFAQDVVAKLFHSLGIDVDVDAMRARLDAEKAEASPPLTAPGEPGAEPGAGVPAPAPDLPDLDELVDLDQMALEAIRLIGWEIIDQDPDPHLFLDTYDDQMTAGFTAVVEAFDAAKHPRAAGGRFGEKPDAPEAPAAPDAGGGGGTDDEIKAKVKELTAQLKARNAAKPKAPKKPPVHPSMKAAEMTSALATLKPDDEVTLTLTNGLEVSGKVTVSQGGSAVIQTADGKYAILHSGLKGVASMTTPAGTTTAAPPTERAPREPKAPRTAEQKAETARKRAETRAANKAAAATA